MEKIKSGFTLVEALVAIFLTVLLIIFVSSVFPQIQRGFQLSENHANAAILGRSLIRGTLSQAFNAMVPYSGSTTISGTKNGRPFARTFNYSVSISSLDTDKKALWATVTWTEGRATKKVILETIAVNPNK